MTGGGESLEQSEVGISSLMDTWLLVRMLESNGERNRLLYVLKSRGMAHSNQMREFQLTDKGIQLVDVYIGSDEVLTGSARLVQAVKDQALALAEHQAEERRQRDLEQEQAGLRAQAEVIARRLSGIGSDLQEARKRDIERERVALKERERLARVRNADQKGR